MDYLYQNDEYEFNVCKLDNGKLLVQVKVKDFSGQFAYCIEDDNLFDYIKSLEQLDKIQQGDFKFSDMDSDSFLYFEQYEEFH